VIALTCYDAAVTYDEWVRAYFDHPEDWDPCVDGDLPSGILPADLITFFKRLFSALDGSLSGYTDIQIGKGLYALIWEGNSDLHALCNLAIPMEDRIACIQAIEGVYARLFAQRCTEHLGHLSEPAGVLNNTCYMWWDIFPITGDSFFAPESKAMNEAILQVMERALNLPNAACQESALQRARSLAEALPGASPSNRRGILVLEERPQT
jgi:hypothetical protein